VLICTNIGGSLAEKGADEACWALIQKELIAQEQTSANPQSLTNPQQNP